MQALEKSTIDIYRRNEDAFIIEDHGALILHNCYLTIASSIMMGNGFWNFWRHGYRFIVFFKCESKSTYVVQMCKDESQTTKPSMINRGCESKLILLCEESCDIK